MGCKNITFTDVNKNQITIKDSRGLDPDGMLIMKTYPYTEDRDIDEIATRPDIYGDDMEMLAYKIWEYNRELIHEAGYDMSKIRALRVPK